MPRERSHGGYSAGLDDSRCGYYYFNGVYCTQMKEIANLAFCTDSALHYFMYDWAGFFFPVCSVVANIYFYTYQHYF